MPFTEIKITERRINIFLEFPMNATNQSFIIIESALLGIPSGTSFHYLISKHAKKYPQGSRRVQDEEMNLELRHLNDVISHLCRHTFRFPIAPVWWPQNTDWVREGNYKIEIPKHLFYQSEWRLMAHSIVDCLMHDDSLLVEPDASNYHQACWWKRFQLERSRNDKVI